MHWEPIVWAIITVLLIALPIWIAGLVQQFRDVCKTISRNGWWHQKH
jgi:hypothetical protein